MQGTFGRKGQVQREGTCGNRVGIHDGDSLPDCGGTVRHQQDILSRVGQESGLRVGKPVRVGTDDGTGDCVEQSVPGASGCGADVSRHVRGEHHSLGGRGFRVFHFQRDDMEYIKGSVPESGNAGKGRVSGERETYRHGRGLSKRRACSDGRGFGQRLRLFDGSRAGQERGDMESGAGGEENAGSQTGAERQRRGERTGQGVREAFPEIETQLDIFHALRDLGNAVRSVEQAEIRRLSKLFDLEYRIQTAKTYLPTKQEYDLMRQNTPLRLLQSDTLRILFDWLIEHTAFSGYGYQDSLELCGWILDEMALLYPNRDSLQQQIRRFCGRLPNLLSFLPAFGVT